MNWIYSLLFLLLHSNLFSQTLVPTRSTNWTLAGLRDTTTIGFTIVDMQTQGVVGNGLTPNDSIIANVLNSNSGLGLILNFPSGNFLFNNTIELSSNVIIKGQGADNTIFTMDLNNSGHSINIHGELNYSDTTSLIESATKDSNFIIVSDAVNFSIGNWVQIIQNDTDLVTSSWAVNSVGQIVKIKNISNNKIFLESPLRMDYDTARSPYIIKINPVKNVGIECIKIYRVDDPAPVHASNISFNYAVNCWVNGIESENCTFSHLKATHSSNLYISKSYFHHAFSYGDFGRAYGVMLQSTSNECLVENNIFEHLRHSMIVQAGANGNVFAYNYSFDSFWDLSPIDAAGDMVLHGNYPYLNLFEQNICQNIVIDDSHGSNGPYNTFFRNRAEKYGIYFSATNSPNQNLLGNEIPNTNLPYTVANYTIQGSGHFIYGNNNKGTIDPVGTDSLIDTSYAYTERPAFVPINQWAKIGTPNIMGSASIPAYDRYSSNSIFSNACNSFSLNYDNYFESKQKVLVYPNPIQSEMTIESSCDMKNIRIFNSLGQEIYSGKNIGLYKTINSTKWEKGVYFVLIYFSNNKSRTVKIEKN